LGPNGRHTEQCTKYCAPQSAGPPEQLLELANSEVARVRKLVKDIGLKTGS
jgi:hypothetical protein